MTYNLTVEITSIQKIYSTGFLYSILEFSMQANVARMLFVYTLQNSSSTTLWELSNLFKESLPKATANALDKAYLATMKCVVVSKTFKKVAEEQT